MNTLITRKEKNNLIIFLTLILFFAGMATDIYIPSLPYITTVFNTTPEKAGFSLSIYIIAASISGLIASAFSDHYGRKPTLHISCIIFIISTACIVISQSINFFIFFRMMQGLAAGFYWIITRQILQDLLNEKEQINANAIVSTAYVFSPAIAPIIGAYIAEYTSWRLCFVLVLGLQIFVFFWIQKIFKESLSIKKKIPHPVTFLGSFLMFFLRKDFNAATIISSSALGGYFAFLIISSFIFIEKLKFSKISFSTIFFALAGLYLFGNCITKILNTRNYPKNKIIFYGIICNFTGSAVLGLTFFSNSIFFISAVIIIGATLMRLGLGLMLALSQIFVMNIFKKSSGQALGTLNLSQSVFAGIAALWVTSFTNSILGLFIVCIVFNGIGVLAYKIFYSNLKFPNLKYRVLKKMLQKDSLKSFLE
jgi:DHA1 family bicyclomycin/chloramphenicol resistance-like MFS transporter